MHTILFIDNDPVLIDTLATNIKIGLDNLNLNIKKANNLESAKEIIEKNSIDLIITDSTIYSKDLDSWVKTIPYLLQYKKDFNKEFNIILNHVGLDPKKLIAGVDVNLVRPFKMIFFRNTVQKLLKTTQ